VLQPRTRSANVLVKVTADDGHVGWGPACPVPQLTGETATSVVEALRERVEPVLVSADPRSWRTLSTRLGRVLYGYPFTRAAVETAPLDLTGRSLGLPVRAVLGGRYRTSGDPIRNSTRSGNGTPAPCTSRNTAVPVDDP
jgi:muconate cycloisomerase